MLMDVFYIVRLSTSSAFYVVPGPIVVFNGVQLCHCYPCNRSMVFLQPVLVPVFVPVDLVFYAVPTQ